MAFMNNRGTLGSVLFSLYFGFFCSFSTADIKKVGDGLDGIYEVVLNKLLPSVRISTPPSNDSSDFAFKKHAKCSYLNWVVPFNIRLRDDQDKQNYLLIDPEEKFFESDIVAAECLSLLNDDSRPNLEIKSADKMFPKGSFFPVKSFIDVLESAFHPSVSYVQNVPSYMEWEVKEGDEGMRERIVIELILHSLGLTAKKYKLNGWSDEYKENFPKVMIELYRNRCIEKSPAELQRGQELQQIQCYILFDRIVRLNNMIEIEIKEDESSTEEFQPNGYSQEFAYAAGTSQQRFYGGGKVFPILVEAAMVGQLLRKLRR